MKVYKIQRLDDYSWYKGVNSWTYNEKLAKIYKQKNHATCALSYFKYDRSNIQFRIVEYNLQEVGNEILN